MTAIQHSQSTRHAREKETAPLIPPSDIETRISNGAEISFGGAFNSLINIAVGIAGIGPAVGMELRKAMVPVAKLALEGVSITAAFMVRFASECRKPAVLLALKNAHRSPVHMSRAVTALKLAIAFAATPQRPHTGSPPERDQSWSHTGNNQSTGQTVPHTRGHGAGINLGWTNTGNNDIRPEDAFRTLLPRSAPADLAIRVFRSEDLTLFTAESKRFTLGVLAGSGRDPAISASMQRLNKRYPMSVQKDFSLPKDRPLFLLTHGTGTKYLLGSTTDPKNTMVSTGLITQALMHHQGDRLPYVFGLCCIGAHPEVGPRFARGGITFAGVDQFIRIDESGVVHAKNNDLVKVYVFFPDGSQTTAQIKFPATLSQIDAGVRAAIQKNRPQPSNH
jgi:hypothetical protein